MNLKKLKNLLKSHDNVTFTKSEDEKTSFSVQFPAKEVLKLEGCLDGKPRAGVDKYD